MKMRVEKEINGKIEFNYEEGVTLIAMIENYCDSHPSAVNRDEWLMWAERLTKLLF